MIGFPATGNMVLGFVSVNGLILEPSPALKIIAFTFIIPLKLSNNIIFLVPLLIKKFWIDK
jgi:hypothetical protein